MTRTQPQKRTQDDDTSSSDEGSSSRGRIPIKRVRSNQVLDDNVRAALLAPCKGPQSPLQSVIVTRTMILCVFCSSVESCNTSVEGVGKRGGKRKVAAAEAGPSSKRQRLDSEDRKQNKQDDDTSSSSDENIPTLVRISRVEKQRLTVDLASTSAVTGSCNTSVEVVGKRGVKRKVATAEGGQSRKRQRLDSEDPKKTKQEELEAKYEQLELLGAGGFGNVYAGHRRADNLPVAIKHIPNDDVYCTHEDDEGNKISIEIAIMLKLAAKSEGASPYLTLLDWYQLEEELVMVIERPIPATDLFDHIMGKGGFVKEKEAKIILRQLVDAALDLENKNIFHRDIKVENILIETSSKVPRVRVIDFGLSCYDDKKETYHEFFGSIYTPEIHLNKGYKAGSTTVFQIGAVLFNTLHKFEKFDTLVFYLKRQNLPQSISKNCKDFLQMCLRIDPNERPTLEQLKNHQWLRKSDKTSAHKHK
ncbi:serine/threonine-protein kinase pim-1-like [Pungitius pungitius]|uniref:serine/threonine-protein kinase pim-1-like n=1 Tax=Pungitius pungitius TaxID=134920 RepID=UPI002E1085A5